LSCCSVRAETVAAVEVRRRENTPVFTQILVPLDGSELAERSLPCAQQLAVLTGATLHLVRVTDLPQSIYWSPVPAYILPSTYDDLLAAEAKESTAYLDAVRERLQAATLQVRTLHLTGRAAATLLDYERDAHIDLVVMASHGRSGLARFALGSVADQLLHHGSAPLLLVRAFGTPATLQRIVVPLDGSPLAEAALPAARVLQGSVVREVALVRVIDAEVQRPEAERYLAEVCRRLQHEQVTCLQQVTLGDPAQIIIDVAGTDKTIVMATHGRSGLTRWALGSVADRVARHAETAVLLLRAGAPVPAGATSVQTAPGETRP
jgi:nucleotide-binding universal stress UspA family protein